MSLYLFVFRTYFIQNVVGKILYQLLKDDKTRNGDKKHVIHKDRRCVASFFPDGIKLATMFLEHNKAIAF